MRINKRLKGQVLKSADKKHPWPYSLEHPVKRGASAGEQLVKVIHNRQVANKERHTSCSIDDFPFKFVWGDYQHSENEKWIIFRKGT